MSNFVLQPKFFWIKICVSVSLCILLSHIREVHQQFSRLICQDDMFGQMEDMPGSCFLKCSIVQCPDFKHMGPLPYQSFQPQNRLPISLYMCIQTVKWSQRVCQPCISEDDCLPGAEPIPAPVQFNRQTPPGDTAEHSSSIIPGLSILCLHCQFVTHLSCYQPNIKCPRCPHAST